MTLSAQEPAPKSIQVVLVENSDLDPSEHRLNYPALISQDKGYRIKCKSQVDEEKVIRGLGFITMPSTVMDPLSELISNAKLEEQPFLCPYSATNYKIKLYRYNSGSGDTFYLQFPTNFNERSYGDALYVAGCSGLLDGLNLSADKAINADPTPFFPDSIYKIDCFNGTPISSLPKTFTEWCVKADLNPEQKKTVNALLAYTPAGAGSLGNELKCKESDSFLSSLSTLNLSNQQIVDLGPVGTLKALTQLILSNNKIVDLAPLINLKGLLLLNLSMNKVQNVSSLAGLTALSDLNLSGNTIVDVRPLSSLAGLKKLNLSSNGLFDLSLPAVSYLTSLMELNLSRNKITNPTNLGDLINLEKLDLSFNLIDSASSLSKIKNTVAVNLEGNPLNVGNFEDLCTLKRTENSPTGFTIRQLLAYSKETSCSSAGSYLESLASMSLEAQGIVDIGPLKYFSNLRDVNLAGNSIEDLSPLSGLTQLNRLKLAKNNIKNIDPLLPLISLTELDLTSNPLELKSFGAWCLVQNKRDFASDADAHTIEVLKNLNGNKSCFESERYLRGIYYLNLFNKAILSLKPLAPLRHLTSLSLGQNDITDLLPLKELTNLVSLNLGQNPNLSSLDGLSSMNKLETLNASNCKIKNILPLSSVLSLKSLSIDSNQIENFQGGANLKSLSLLSIGYNPLKNLSSINSLTSLKSINIANSSVNDIQPLGELPALEYANLTNVNVVYSSLNDYCLVSKFQKNVLGSQEKAYTALEELMTSQGTNIKDCPAVATWSLAQTSLTLNDKGLADVTPLKFLTNLTYLNLNGNQISNLVPISNLRALQSLYMEKNALSNMDDIQTLQQLQNLYVSENSISTVYAISHLPNLVNLSLRKNNVKDASPLAYLTKFASIDLRNNQMDKDDVIRKLATIAQSRGALDKRVAIGFYVGGNALCNIYYTGIGSNEFNQIKTRACTEEPWRFRRPIDVIIDRPIIRQPVEVIHPPLRPIIGVGGHL